MKLLAGLLLAVPALAQGNLLLVVADDVGVERIGAYGVHPSPPPTVTIDRLADEGVLFRHCWSNPFCSPTRATYLTGRYSQRTHIGWFIGDSPLDIGLSLGEWTLPEIIEAGSGAYRSALVGKWHLAGFGHGPDNPNLQGFEHYAGHLDNLGPPGTPERYYHFEKIVDGVSRMVHRYATTDTVDDALRAVEAFAGDPFLLVVSFNAPHVPYHRPPAALHSHSLGGDPAATPIAHHEAAVEALDRELGRLLAGIPPAILEQTTIAFLGDNGTQKPATESPWPADHGKGTLYQGGVQVPLILWGRGVTARGSECRALTNTVDLLPTLCELVGIDAQAVVGSSVTLDGRSLVPYLSQPDRPSDRSMIYAEAFRPNGNGPYSDHRRAARDIRYKLMRDELSGVEQLYDLASDPFEQHDLLKAALTESEREAWRGLRRFLADL